MSAKALLFCLVCGLILAGLSLANSSPRLIWNRTGSLPIGLYAVRNTDHLKQNDLVAYQPPQNVQVWLEARGYIGHDWPLIKQIAALEGDKICRSGANVTVNGRHVAQALQHDLKGRSLPDWQGCQRLEAGDIFLLAPHPRSIDGRYFGIQKTDGLLGQVWPIWVPANTAGTKAGDMAEEHIKAEQAPAPGLNE